MMSMHKTLIVNFPGPATALTCRHPAAKQREKWDSAEDSFTFQAARGQGVHGIHC
jgi:hypothetical protein